MVVLFGDPPQKMIGQGGNILSSGPERRDSQAQNIEPIIQVLTKRTAGDAIEQVEFGRGHNTHIGLDDAVASDAFEDLLLDDPQQLGLLVQRNIVDIVQVNGPAVRELEPAGAILIRTREGSFLVSVQFALNQGRWQQRAAHFYVRCFVAVGLPVDDRGHQVLPNTRLAVDQDIGISLRGDANHAFHTFDRGGNANDLAVNVAPTLGRRARANRRGVSPVPIDVRQQRPEFFGGNRLLNEVVLAKLDRLDSDWNRTVGAHQDHGSLGARTLLDSSQ